MSALDLDRAVEVAAEQWARASHLDGTARADHALRESEVVLHLEPEMSIADYQTSEWLHSHLYGLARGDAEAVADYTAALERIAARQRSTEAALREELAGERRKSLELGVERDVARASLAVERARVEYLRGALLGAYDSEEHRHTFPEPSDEVLSSVELGQWLWSCVGETVIGGLRCVDDGRSTLSREINHAISTFGIEIRRGKRADLVITDAQVHAAVQIVVDLLAPRP